MALCQRHIGVIHICIYIDICIYRYVDICIHTYIIICAYMHNSTRIEIHVYWLNRTAVLIMLCAYMHVYTLCIMHNDYSCIGPKVTFFVTNGPIYYLSICDILSCAPQCIAHLYTSFPFLLFVLGCLFFPFRFLSD
jgi:hypothetical protein